DRALQRLCLVVCLVPRIAKYPDQEMLEKVMTTQDTNGELPSFFRQLNVFVALLPCKPEAFQSAQGLGDSRAAHARPFSEPGVADVSVVPFQDVDAAEVFRRGREFCMDTGKIHFHYKKRSTDDRGWIRYGFTD